MLESILNLFSIPKSHQSNFDSEDFLHFDSKTPKSLKKAAVCLLLFKENNRLKLGMIQRRAYEGVHSNQIGFAGGKIEISDQNLVETAQRECFEELGISIKNNLVLAKLDDISIDVSGFLVRPYLVYFDGVLDLKLDPREVKSFLGFNLEHLFDNQNVIRKTIEVRTQHLNVQGIQINDHFIWGASFRMIQQLKSWIYQ